MLENKYYFILYGAICLMASLVSVSCRKPVLYKETRISMGTMLSVEMTVTSGQPADGIMAEVWAEADRLEKIFSRYMDGSEINRINQKAFERPVRVSGDMMAVLRRAEEISRLTDGAFDITIGPLMEIWGFFPRGEGRLPSDMELTEILARVDWRSVRLNQAERTVRFLKAGLEIDLGGLAKGYVVDRIALLLADRGIRSALVNAGGDIYCLGSYPDGRDWRIGMEHPRGDDEILTVLELKDRAVATSGDYRNYFIRSQRRYSHIIDPRSGRPAGSGVVEASVVAPDCLTADALATALFVMGAADGLELLNGIKKVDGVIVTEGEDDVSMHFSNRLLTVSAGDGKAD